MTPTEFCYWLQGRAELLPDQPPTADEWKMIREHLALAFVKVTPPKPTPSPSYQDVQMALRPNWVDPTTYTQPMPGLGPQFQC